MSSVDDIALVFTPPGGWTDWPEPFLAECSDPLPEGAPDIDGWWRSIEVLVDDEPQAEHAMLGQLQRIEQVGDRVIVTSGGVIHDMRCDASLDNGVHDVAAFDKTAEVHVVASYEDGVHTLRPNGLDIEVLRWRDGAHLMWQYLGFTARLEKLAPSSAPAAQVVTQET